MLDIFNIPGQQDNIKIFYASDTNAWQTWTRPRNCKFVWMMCIGGGAGGSGGSSGVGNPPTTYNGGGGGCSAAVTRAIFPANVLPDILYIQPGPGGAGGTAGFPPGQSSGGNRSFVSIVASSATPMNLVCTSGLVAATGTLTNTGETAATTAAAGLLSLGNFISVAGGASVGQVDVTPLSGTITSVGTAGGYANSSAGGTSNAILATTISPLLQSSAVTSGTAIDGVSFSSLKPFFSTGGCGGGAFTQNTGNGGKGGDGGYGSGGGGGGAAFNGTGGVGGKGGNGLVIIATF
jgi:hypothetical protein